MAPRRSARGWAGVAGMVAITAAALVVHQSSRLGSPPEPEARAPETGVILIVPAGADPLTARLASAIAGYLGTLAGRDVPVVEAEAGALDLPAVERIARAEAAGLVVVLEAERLAPTLLPPARIEALGGQGFVLETHEVGDFSNGLGDRGATVVLTAGPDRLSRQYAAYELLRRLGVRFFHPEQEYVPAHAPADLRPLARRPTVLHRAGEADDRPDFRSRSWTFHGPHPLEHLEAFSDAAHPIDEAVHVNDWIVKNFGNRFRGPGRGVASAASAAERGEQLERLRERLGFPRGASISLHNLQQGADAEIDAAGDVPVREQIDALVAEKLAAAPDAVEFGVHFGATEFTVTPDAQTVQWLNWVGEAVHRQRPELPVWINDHITGHQPSPHFDDLGCPSGTNDDGRIDYYDLAFHTDPRLGVSVHTVMFYPLEGPAGVYNQRSFAHKLCLMQRASARGRPLRWFPEGAWWLSFDNPIPMYLPLYIATRARDIELLRPLLASRGEGTLVGHRMFDSGHEWGYWQQDYAVGLMAWNADITARDVLGELFDPLCAPARWRQGCPARTEAIAVLEEVIEHQRALFLTQPDVAGRPGGLYAYFAGEDAGDEIAAASGLEFRPVRVPFAEVMRWDAAELDRFATTDLAALDQAAAAYEGWAARLRAQRDAVPEAGRPWLAETLDGIEIDGLRAAQGAALYGAVVELRRATLAGHPRPAAAAADAWARAQRVLEGAEAVVRRRERAYRYPPAQTHGGGLSPEDGQANGTPYPFRVHTKTHHLTYWTGRHQQVAELLERSQRVGLRLGEALAGPGVPLALQWPRDATGAITVGPHAVDPTMDALALGDAPGTWAVEGTLELGGGAPLVVRGTVVRSDVRATTPRGGMTLTIPEDATARRVLGSVLPSLRWAWVDDPPALVFAPDVDRDGQVAFEDLVVAPVAQGDRAGFRTAPITFELPVSLASGGSPLFITLSNAVLRGRVGPQGLVHPLRIEAEISIEDIVAAAEALAGFDERGMHALLAGMFGFDASAVPETAPIAAELHLADPAAP